MVVAECEHLILVNGAEFLDNGGRPIVAVCLVKAEELHSSGQREEQYAGSNENTDV